MFQFDLEAVLNYRLQVEEQCQLSLAEVVKNLQVAMDVLEGLQKEKNDLIRHLVRMQENALTSDVIARHFIFIEFLKSKEEKQEAIIINMREEVSAKRQDLLEAVKKRKVMDALREKKMAAYVSEMAAKERKELDDFSVIKFSNGMRK
ncbi:flagellar export protein FliJ [bacterium]|jgi:flagellar FliJ protein|nr:MAG: flagellar export protein FliJ [bacterium]